MLGRLVMRPLLGAAITAAAGAALIVGSAQVSIPVPGTSVPQTLQTVAVLLAGGVFGPFGGAAAVALYLALGAAGVPVFAGEASGWSYLTGTTSGYLWGFLAGAFVIGYWPGKRTIKGFFSLLLGCAVAHALILAFGWFRLFQLIGATNAFERGVEPFLTGGAAKTVLAAVLLWGWRHIRTRIRLPRFLLPM